ncbi:MAG: protease inhibitor I42 family protein [Phycisphaerae bacterium]|nr:protease inhibitor I42 family protein [Phycisphaerae bacterium]
MCRSSFLIVLCVLAVGHSSLLYADSQEEVTAVVGEEFTVALASNPSTGYSWSLAGSLPSWLVQVDKTYIADNPGMIGGGGTEYWTFRATGAGSTTLTFQYMQPWVGTPIEEHIVLVTAQTPTDTEKIDVIVGKEFTVALASNPSTGYGWSLAGSLPSWLVQVDKTYVADNPGVIGGGGTECWTFRATGPGSTTLTFQYMQPWVGTPIEEHVVLVTAQTPTDTEKIDVIVGEEFTVALASNPSTGYNWSLAASLPSWLVQVDKTYVADNPGMIGGGGTEYWTFRATGAGSTTLTFQYERPWEGTPIQIHICRVAASPLTNAQNIFVAAGEDFTVALASNPSTGYSWALAQSLPSWLVQVDKTHVTTNPGVTGGGGTEYWKFRADTAGSTTLTFQYKRPWEGTPVKVRVCEVTAISPTDAENLFVVAGEDFTVALASNPSTGYSWALAQSLPSWLVQVDKTYVATNPGVIGGGGTEHWTFWATAAGNAALIFQYERPSGGTPLKVHVCKLTAAEQ